MARTLTPPAADATLEPTERDLSAIIQLVYQRSGITLHRGKRELVTARLQKRVRGGGFASFAAYLAHVQADRSGQAMTTLLDAIATNHTHFFRESRHFDVLAEHAAQLKARCPGGVLEGWSAACSTGEEPYTILMRLREAGHDTVRLLASDISTKALAKARAGVYPMAKVADVPLPAAAPLLREGPRRAGGAGARRAAAPQAGRLPRPQPARHHVPRPAVRLHLLPQRDDLLRQGHPAAGRDDARAAPQAGRLPVHRALGEPERHHPWPRAAACRRCSASGPERTRPRRHAS